MRVYHNLPTSVLDRPSNLSIGNFDGLHLGHQALLRAMATDAHQRNRQAGLLTFDPHPATVLHPHSPQPYLTTIAERLDVVEALGLDFAVVYPFVPETARTPAFAFVAQLKDALRLQALWVGPDFALGRNREGDVDALRVLGRGLGYTVHVIEPQVIGGGEVRSGRIRQHLLEGQVEIAAQLLGRPYKIDGIVVDGAHRGRTIGFPTANLSVPPGRLLPANGVYATWVLLDDQPDVRLPGVTNVGVRPSFDNGQRTVETHLLDFSGDLYASPMTLDFVAHLRPEMRFPTVRALSEQIAQDVAAARRILLGDRVTR
jgi:riboflavin kinase/FMN adenylyltransferase